jgi:hypothetical protein
MRIHLKWFITGKVTPLEERDELLGPATTVLEVKGLIQLKYTYPAKHMLLIAGKQLLENETTLAEAGIVDQAAADDATHVLTVHVLSGADLEDDDDDDEVAANTKTGSSIHEFTHEDFIKASKMLGRELPVSRARAAEVRAAAPRARPSFLDAKPAVAEDPPVFQDTTAATRLRAPLQSFRTAPVGHRQRTSSATFSMGCGRRGSKSSSRSGTQGRRRSLTSGICG